LTAAPGSAKTIEELRALSDDDLITEHDELAGNTVVGTDYYLNELVRRETERQGRRCCG